MNNINAQKSYPHLYLEITRKCNLFCPHCFNNSIRESSLNMSLTDVKKVLNNFVTAGGRSLQITGGEVFMRDDILAILKYARKIGIQYIILSTNGTICTNEQIDDICKYADEVYLSIDGFEKDNDLIRGKGSFKKTYNTLVELGKRQQKISVYTSLTPKVLNYLEEFINWLIEKNVYFLNISPIGNVGRGSYISDEMIFDKTEYLHLYKKLTKIKRKYFEKIKISHPLTTNPRKFDLAMEDWICNPKGQLGLLIGGDVSDKWILGNAKKNFQFNTSKLQNYVKIMDDIIYEFEMSSKNDVIHMWEAMVEKLINE